MGNEFFVIAIAVIAMFAAIIIFIATTIRNSTNPGKANPEAYEALDEEIEMPEAEIIGAVAISKRMDGYWGGNIKTPTYNQCYFVTFLTDDGEEKEYMVGKETFDKIYEGQASTLVTSEGQFFAFDDGEEVKEDC